MKPVGALALHELASQAPRIPKSCRHHASELARWEWRLGDPGDPAALASAFLASHGLGLSASDDHPLGVCGAVMLISAAAGSVMANGPVGSPTPAPAVPDLAIVVYGHGPRHRRAAAPTDSLVLGPWRPSWTPQQHADAVEAVRTAIAAGDVYQVNVVGHAAAEYSGDPRAALQRLTMLSGAHYAGIMTGDGWAIGCASPETLVEVRNGLAVTRPIKGTAPATAAGRLELLTSEKERAEHIMIVDLERNDLSHVAKVGSVRVPELFAVRRWADLWQAESDVEAQLRPEVDLAELLRALCPGGSVTGAPKLAALKQIAALEPVGRGPAMGALGWVGPGYVDLGLTIRTVAVDADRVHLWAGGGITIDSDPWAEVAEAAAKAAPVRAALAS